MELLPESLDLHSAEGTAQWRVRALEHVFWFASRGLLILFIVLVAFVAHIPFQRLLQRDVALEMEEAQKEKLLSQFKLIDSLSVSAVKFQAALDDVIAGLLNSGYGSDIRAGDSFNTKLRRSADALDRLRNLFEAREVPLDDRMQDATEHLIEDGDNALSICQASASDMRSGSRLRDQTFQAEKELIAIDIADISGYEQIYVSMGRNDGDHGN